MVNRQTIRRKIFHLVLSGVLLFSLGAIALLPQPVSAMPDEKALSFDGIDNYVDVGNDASLDITGDNITLEAWVKAAVDAEPYTSIVRKQDINGFPYLLSFDGGMHFRLYTQTSSGAVPAVSPLTYNDNEWHYVVGVYNGVEQLLYVDGVEVASASQSGNLISISGSLKIGAGYEPAAHFFKGDIDEVRISNVARTQAEITAAWNGGIGERFVLDPNTLALWHMDEGSGDIIGDATANDNDGTIYGGPMWVEGFLFSAEEGPVGPVALGHDGGWTAYDTIQEAIDAAVDGDEIIVFPGTYYGQIVIDKQITVKSRDGAATTIIDAQQGKGVVCDFGGGVSAYPAVWIQRDGVVFGDLDMGFTIMNTPPMEVPEGEENPSGYGVAILAADPECTIRGNIIEASNPIGIFADVDMTIIDQNNVSASIMGIFGGGGGGSITGNIVNSALYGIMIESGQGNNTISNNTVSNTWGGAIMVQLGDNHQITNNELYDNQGTAIGLQQTSNAEISGNTITKATSSIAGIYGIQVEGGNNNTISGNTINNVLVGGISLNDTSDNRLSANNNISNIFGYSFSDEYSGKAEWTREQVRFERFSVKMETGEDPSGVARLEIPTISPFQYAEIAGGLRFWAYLPGGVTPLPTWQLELDVVLNGVVTLEGYTECEGGPRPDEWLSCSTTGMWKNVDTTETKPLSEWINIFPPGTKVVKRSVVYAGDANRTVYIDGFKHEGIPIEPPTGIAILKSGRNSVSDSTVLGVNGVGVLIVESYENMIDDGNDISENGIGIVMENSKENTVRGSLISDNDLGIGIYRSHNNQIIGNNITGNTGGMSGGVHLDGDSGGNEIHANNIAGNTAFGVFKDGGDWVNASGNWWGDDSGPSGVGPGNGDAVSDFVNFEPWATRWPDVTEPTMEPPLAMPRMTAVLGMFMGDVGLEQTSLVVEAYDDEGGVGIAKVSVNLRELLMQMLPSPIVIELRNDNEPFDALKVRQAMSLALDYEALRSELGGYGNIVLNPEEELPTEYNPETARALLEQAGYPEGFQTEIYMHWHYTKLASMLHDYWCDIGVLCEIKVVDMGKLIEKIEWSGANTMVSYPYGWGMIPMNKLDQWQNWLSELERNHLEHHDKEVYEGVYQRQFSLQEDFMRSLAWYLGEENDTQKIMDKLRLGDFSIPVTVADWCGNEVGSNIDLTIVDIMQPLKKGWNLVSTPVTLDDNYATWENLVALGNSLWFDDAIRYDSALGEWVDVHPTDELKPLEPIYIHATWNDQIGIIFNRGVTPPPMLDLDGGWNLVGLAIPPVEWDSMPVNEAMVTVEDADIVVSPPRQFDYSYEYWYRDTEGREYGFGGYVWNFQQNSWVYTVGAADIPEMSIGGGYWVFMEAADTLAGFSTTPVTMVNAPEEGQDIPMVPRYDWERVTRTDYDEYHDGGYTKVYLTYSGDVSPSRVVEFYQQRMAEYGWELTAWEGSEDSASLDFALVMGDAHASCQIGVVGGESIDILYELWEPGVDLPDMPRFEWEPVVMTAYSQFTDDFGTQTNISYEGELEPDRVKEFYKKRVQNYGWGECIGEEWQNEFGWFVFRRNDEQGRTYICLIWAEKGIIEIEHHQYAASVTQEYIDGVISLWRQEIEMRKWAMW